MNMSVDPGLMQDLKKADLRYIADSTVGISRHKYGTGFRYISPEGKVISQKASLDRFEDLAIPPAWRNVWICPSPTGYLQATGFDEKGRKQYLYHEDWQKIAQENKFGKMAFFGEVLPEIRAKINKDMLIDAQVREKILATVIWLLEHTFIRIGNKEYAEENNSFGLTTLRTKHVTVRGKEVKFEFKGKSGVEHSVEINNPKIAKIIKECVELPGYEIFQYIDDQGEKHTVDSADVNDYLKEITGEDITAKDFRTWGGTVLSADTLYLMGPYEGEEMLKDNVCQAIKKVSQHLRNTTAVCRNYYVHPTVLKSYEDQILIPHFDKHTKSSKKPTKLSPEEYAVITLLNKYA